MSGQQVYKDNSYIFLVIDILNLLYIIENCNTAERQLSKRKFIFGLLMVIHTFCIVYPRYFLKKICSFILYLKLIILRNFNVTYTHIFYIIILYLYVIHKFNF